MGLRWTEYDQGDLLGGYCESTQGQHSGLDQGGKVEMMRRRIYHSYLYIYVPIYKDKLI